MEVRDRRRFVGAVVSSEVVTVLPVDLIDITRDGLRLSPLLRRRVTIDRHEIGALEVERVWVFPLMARTVIRFRYADGTYAPKVATVLRTGAFRRACEELGWPVERVALASTEPRTVRERS